MVHPAFQSIIKALHYRVQRWGSREGELLLTKLFQQWVASQLQQLDVEIGCFYTLLALEDDLIIQFFNKTSCLRCKLCHHLLSRYV